jgi:hypothetical protein
MHDGSARRIGNREIVDNVLFPRSLASNVESLTDSVLFFMHIIFTSGPRPKAA